MSWDDKSEEMKNSINSLCKHWFGKTAEEHFKDKTCVTCNSSIVSFNDALSLKEYGISGMCQNCQDEVFTE